jgi:transcriptional regulator with XRE-family HTH domain
MHISGKQVAAARELLGITQVELAEATGLSFITIHNFEANKSEPYRATLEKIVTELERRGIEFTNGTGIGVRLNFEKAAAFARTNTQSRNESTR